MTRLFGCLTALLFFTLALPASATLNVFACEPEWSALAGELGGDKVNLYSATTGLQDPHRVEAKPSLLARARNADLVVCSGAELEIGWLPVVLREASNGKIQPGSPGYFEAAQYLRLLEKPARLDRSEGDVHPFGNPHIQTDPRNIALVAQALAKRLAQLDPPNTAYYQSRQQSFSARWTAAIQRWEARAAPLKNMPVAVQHKAFSYLIQWLGLNEVATLEPKPGIEPSAAYLSEVLAQLQRQPVKMVIRASYQSDRPSNWIAQRANIPAVALATTVGGTANAKDLFSLFDDTLQRLLDANK